MKKIDIKVLNTLLSQKRPSASEKTYRWFSFFLHDLGVKTQKDEFNNHYLSIGESNIIFSAHYDTVHRTYGKNECYYDAIKEIFYTDQKRGGDCLGADDGAGIWLMLKMIEAKKPGHYVFFADEEIGGVGSGNFDLSRLNQNVDAIISFDRMNDNEVIISQMCGQIASNESGEWLAEHLTSLGLEYHTSHLGSFTDSANFSDQIPECFNLSIGYYHQHTNREFQDFAHLKKLAKALTILDFTTLPIKRDPSFNYSQTGLYDYVKQNPGLVTEYLDLIGVTIDEIELNYFNDYNTYEEL